jgi:hypothetical protein
VFIRYRQASGDWQSVLTATQTNAATFAQSANGAEYQVRYKITNGPFHLYQVRFSKLGENRLTVRYGNGCHLYLEFFSTEPIETLIKKRAAFIARCQHRNPDKWYDGLISEWNMET